MGRVNNEVTTRRRVRVTGQRVVGAGLAGAAMAVSIACAAAPADAAPQPKVKPTVVHPKVKPAGVHPKVKPTQVQKTDPTMDNIKLALNRLKVVHPELTPAAQIALALFP